MLSTGIYFVIAVSLLYELMSGTFQSGAGCNCHISAGRVIISERQ